MGVRLTVMGSSPAYPNPGAAHSGYLLEAGGCGRLLLDCGPGVLSRLRAAELLPVDAIAITHFHLDHWGDLVAWAWFSAHGNGGAPPPALWIPPGGSSGLAAYALRWGTESMFTSAFQVQEYAAGKPFDAAGFAVQPQPVDHYGVPAFGFRVEGPDGCVLGYSGDSAPCDGLRTIASGAGLFLCEATLAAATHDANPRGHMSADEALEVARGRTLLTHRPAELPVPAGGELARDGLVAEIDRPA
jgi:ribonuclease BN (tRNA processing enzyme)